MMRGSITTWGGAGAAGAAASSSSSSQQPFYAQSAAGVSGGTDTGATKKAHHFKLVLLGDTSVGKSCIVVRFAKDEFYEYQESTIGAAFMTQSVDVGNCIVKFEIWDTAGQERYRSLAPMYYRGAAAAVVVYDITNRDSFQGAKSWIQELQVVNDRSSIVIVRWLSSSTEYLQHSDIVDNEEAQQYAEEQGVLFIETSAKTGHNVSELFYEIGKGDETCYSIYIECHVALCSACLHAGSDLGSILLSSWNEILPKSKICLAAVDDLLPEHLLPVHVAVCVHFYSSSFGEQSALLRF